MSGYHHRHSRAKSTARSPGKTFKDLEEDPSFSSSSSLRNQTRGMIQDTGRCYRNKDLRRLMEIRHSSSSSQSSEFGLGCRGTCGRDSSVDRTFLDSEDSDFCKHHWRGSVSSSVDSTETSYAATSFSSYRTCSSSTSIQSESRAPSEATSTGTLKQSDDLGPSSTESRLAKRPASLSRRMEASPQSYEALKMENLELKRKLASVQTFSGMQTEMVKSLERKLQARIAKEDVECQALELVGRQTKEKLTLMSRRAQTAEHQVLKLKEDLRALEIQLIYFQRENQLLTRPRPKGLKQSAGTVLQNIDVVRNSIQGSLKHLVYGADALKLVVEILKSVDQIAKLKEEEDQ